MEATVLRPFRLAFLLAGLLGTFAGGLPAVADTIRAGGTGAALGMLRHLGTAFAASTGTDIEVVPSLGTNGGIRALQDGVLELAVIGRPLTGTETAAGARQVLTIQTPYILATSLEHPGSVARKGVARMFADARAKWPDGTPVRVILRPTIETDYIALYAAFPGTEAAVATLRRRGDVPLAATDQDNQGLAETLDGSLIGTTFTQYLMERRNLRMVPIDGVVPSTDTLATGAYPYDRTMYFIAPVRTNPTVDGFFAFLRSPTGQQELRATGNLLGRE
jgi:phosphate transport system substrate-binding protein